MTFGKIHSFQSLGTVDGPGVRAVVFMQGCPLRCVCCHNPDTWNIEKGTTVSVQDVFSKILRCKNYFGEDGGVTISGGEPLMQSDFLIELFGMLKEEKINITLDTSGCVLNDSVKKLLDLTDLVLLDYKYTNDEDYFRYTECEKKAVDNFLEYLNENKKKVWLRQVIISDLNDNEESVKKLYALKNKYSCVEKIELLPFRKLCIEKYKSLGLEFKLENTSETTNEQIDNLLKSIKQ